MVSLYRRYAVLFLVTFSALLISPKAFSFSSETFPNTNTIPTTSGGKARLVGITSINPASRSANVVIDARDRFGNPMRRFKTGIFSPAKIKSYVRSCLRNPVACVAVSALSAALVHYGYTVTSDGDIFIAGSGVSYPQCVEKPMESDTGSLVGAVGPIPCTSPPDWRGNYWVRTESPLSSGTYQDTLTSWGYREGDSVASRITYYRYTFSSEPLQQPQEITDAALANIALESPQHLQIAPGVYPDLFEAIDLTEDTATESDLDGQPQPEPEPDPAEEYEEMIGMDAVPEEIIDISEFFAWGSGWLPRTCPGPKTLISLHDQDFVFEYDQLCSLIVDYISPFIRLLAVMAFLGIVIRGARA